MLQTSHCCPPLEQAIKNEELKALPEYAGQGEERHGSPEASEAELGDEMEAALHQGALNSIAKARQKPYFSKLSRFFG